MRRTPRSWRLGSVVLWGLAASTIPACATGAASGNDGEIIPADTGLDADLDGSLAETDDTATDETADTGGDDATDGSVVETASEGGEVGTDAIVEVASETPVGSCPTAPACPAGWVDLDGDPHTSGTGTCGCEYACTFKSATDPIDPDATDDNCDGSDGVVEHCVFVATDGDDGNAGTNLKPMKTIAAAITKAQSLGAGHDVCLSTESYNGLVTMASGVSIYGGFDEKDADFPFRRHKDGTTTLTASGTVVMVPKADVDTHLEALTITATGVSDTPTHNAASVYGVRYAGGTATFYVRWNTITVAGGNPGSDGIAGTAGDSGGDGGKGNNGCTSCSGGGGGGGGGASTCGAAGGKGGDGGFNGAGGTDGKDGTGAKGGPGRATNGCSVTSSPPAGGGGGTPVDDGSNGGPGASSSALGSVSPDASYFSPVAPKGSNGQPGKSGGGAGGGGGGGTGPCAFGVCVCNADTGSGGGGGGAGGCGGSGGTGGQGGGGSFGVTVAGGTCIIDGNSITTGKGGKGGDGQGGANGGSPGTGNGGGDREDDGGPGGTGGNGTKGGIGGPGSAGVGGPSACVAFPSSANVTFVVGKANNFCSRAGGGDSGNPGTNSGMSGAFAPSSVSADKVTF